MPCLRPRPPGKAAPELIRAFEAALASPGTPIEYFTGEGPVLERAYINARRFRNGLLAYPLSYPLLTAAAQEQRFRLSRQYLGMDNFRLFVTMRPEALDLRSILADAGQI